jgi:hypothetical protein
MGRCPVNVAPDDFWVLLLGDEYPHGTPRIGETFYARCDVNKVVLELAPHDDGVSVVTHAGFLHERLFPFSRYFSATGLSKLVPRIEKGTWWPRRPPEHELQALRDDLRAYINLWMRPVRKD